MSRPETIRTTRRGGRSRAARDSGRSYFQQPAFRAAGDSGLIAISLGESIVKIENLRHPVGSSSRQAGPSTMKPGLVVTATLILFAGFWATRARSQQPEQAGPNPRRDAHLIMISIDGMPPDYYTNPAAIGLKVPTLTSMKLDGAFADGVEGVYPAVTYPAHTTLVTGVLPAIHGIVQNRIFEPPTGPQTRSWYWFASALKAETLWMAAKKAGLSVGAVGWPVTAGADVDYNFPEIWDPAEQPITPRRALQYSTPGLVDKVVSSMGTSRGDQFRTNVAEYII